MERCLNVCDIRVLRLIYLCYWWWVCMIDCLHEYEWLWRMSISVTVIVPMRMIICTIWVGIPSFDSLGSSMWVYSKVWLYGGIDVIECLHRCDVVWWSIWWVMWLWVMLVVNRLWWDVCAEVVEWSSPLCCLLCRSWWSVESSVVHGGLLCGWMIAYFSDLLSGEDERMIESFSRLVVKVSYCCCFSCPNENSTLFMAGERLLYVVWEGLLLCLIFYSCCVVA